MLKTAGIIIIGDEVLKGDVNDLNAPFLCKRFRKLGIEVSRISTIPDKINVISEEIIKFSKSFNFVITTGGVGPTHNDVTYESIAAAFNEDLQVNDELQNFYNKYLAKGDNIALKLVTIPKCAEVIPAHLEEPLENCIPYFPIVKTFNVYSFSGIPLYLQRTFTALECKYFRNGDLVFFSRMIYLKTNEVHLLTILSEIVVQFRDSVTFGCYPQTSEASEYETKITIESIVLSECLAAEQALLSRIPPYWVTYLKPKLPDFDFIYRISQLNINLSEALMKSFQIIEETFLKYNVLETFISFNGGKDCTVLFNLVYCYCLRKNMHKFLKLVYFKEQDSFPEIDSFIEDIKNCYEVDLVILPTPMKNSLQLFLEKEPKRKASFIGLRKIDPKSENVKSIQETDSDWPKLMRISPMLHWSYINVWDFIRCFNIPYCCLYNQGYTSLGSRNNTTMNPSLKFQHTDGCLYYKPAFLLHKDYTEREGRT